jgi:hypothetical protein
LYVLSLSLSLFLIILKPLIKDPEIVSYWIGLRKYVDVTNKEKWMWSDLNSTIYNDVS